MVKLKKMTKGALWLIGIGAVMILFPPLANIESIPIKIIGWMLVTMGVVQVVRGRD